jgi:hypothetical protein
VSLFLNKTKPDNHTDQLDKFTVKSDPNEMRQYSEIVDKRLEHIFSSILDGFTIKRLNHADCLSALRCLKKHPLSKFPSKHLVVYAKWIGTSVIRKIHFIDSQYTMYRIYQELAGRGDLDHILLFKTKNSMAHDNFDPCTSIPVSHPDILSQVSSSDVDLKIRQLVGTPALLVEAVDMLVGFSNLNIYDFAFFQSLKVLITRMLDGPEELRHFFLSQMDFKLLNIYWAYKKLGVDDPSFYHLLFASCNKSLHSMLPNKCLYYIWALSLEYANTPISDPATPMPPLPPPPMPPLPLPHHRWPPTCSRPWASTRRGCPPQG